MLQLDPAHRPSATEVLAHDWFKGPTTTKAEVVAEFKKRQEVLNASIEEGKAEKMKEKERR